MFFFLDNINQQGNNNIGLEIDHHAKNENILTHWSVAQAGSNDEKNGGRKSRWTVPLNIISSSVRIYLQYIYAQLIFPSTCFHLLSTITILCNFYNFHQPRIINLQRWACHSVKYKKYPSISKLDLL